MANPRVTRIAELKAQIESAKAEIAQIQADVQADKAENSFIEGFNDTKSIITELGQGADTTARVDNADGNLQTRNTDDAIAAYEADKKNNELLVDTKSSGLGLDGNRNDQGDFVEADSPLEININKSNEEMKVDFMEQAKKLGLKPNTPENHDHNKNIIYNFAEDWSVLEYFPEKIWDDELDKSVETGNELSSPDIKAMIEMDWFQEAFGDEYDSIIGSALEIDINRIQGELPPEEKISSPEDDLDKDERTDAYSEKQKFMGIDREQGRAMAMQDNLPERSMGFKADDGGNMSVDEKDDFWKTQEGYDKALEMYGSKPAWVKEPTMQWNPSEQKYEEVEEEEFEDLSRPSISADIKKLFG
jgi:hypothetical protein